MIIIHSHHHHHNDHHDNNRKHNKVKKGYVVSKNSAESEGNQPLKVIFDAGWDIFLVKPPCHVLQKITTTSHHPPLMLIIIIHVPGWFNPYVGCLMSRCIPVFGRDSTTIPILNSHVPCSETPPFQSFTHWSIDHPQPWNWWSLKPFLSELLKLPVGFVFGTSEPRAMRLVM